MKSVRSGLLALVMLSTAAISQPASASLLGDTITGTGPTLTPMTATIGAGVEFTGISGSMDFDFDANTLTISSKNSLVFWDLFGDYVFSGFDKVITSVSLISNTGFDATFINDFSFTSDSITFNMLRGEVTHIDTGDTAVFRIKTSSVPEPSSLALLGLAAAGLVTVLRKNSA